MGENNCFDSVAEGSRILCRLKSSLRVLEDILLERSPSGEFVKFGTAGWLSKSELSHYELVEVLGGPDEPEDDMCPNCVTPWKCNGPHEHRKCRSAPGGSPQLEMYLNYLGIYGNGRQQ